MEAKDVKPDDLPEVPATSYNRDKYMRFSIRQLNRKEESMVSGLKTGEHSTRSRLLKQWDKVPLHHKLDILTDLIKGSLPLAVILILSPAAMALTAYEKPSVFNTTIADDDQIVALVHSYSPPKGKKEKKTFYYRLKYNAALYESTHRFRKYRKQQVIDERPLSVIHPKMERWRQRILFFGPFWQLFTDTAVKGAVGSAAAGSLN